MSQLGQQGQSSGMTSSTALPYSNLPPRRRRTLGIWMAAWAGMVMFVVIIGGITRLTESGLSITEWAPVSGVLPPLTEQGWEDAFRAYQQIPEYQQLNPGMTLAQFKTIYFWEYIHRVWARLIGLALVVPWIFFGWRRWLNRQLQVRLSTLFILTVAQGALGWIMVMSGLTERTDVSQYRLAAHLGLALVIYVIAVWTAADLLRVRADSSVRAERLAKLRMQSGTVALLVFAAALAGAFVAGLNGGMAYNSFPLMGGQFVPAGYLTLDPWWVNLFENVAAVQFNHRWIGVGAFAATVALWLAHRKTDVPTDTRRWLNATPLVALAQVALGIATLVLAVPIPIAALHQLGAVLLLTVTVLAYHSVTRATQSSMAAVAQTASLAS